MYLYVKLFIFLSYCFFLFSNRTLREPLGFCGNRLENMQEGFDITSSNVQGLKDSLKRFNTFNQLKTLIKSDVFFLQDTHWNSEDYSKSKLVWRGKLFHSPACGPRGAGVSILFNPLFDFKVLSIDEIVQSRALRVRIIFHEEIYSLVNIYAPNDGNERLDFFEILSKFLSNIERTDNLILAGDFNSTLLPTLDRLSKKETHTASANKLQEIINKHDLTDPWRAHIHNKAEFTWVGHNGKSRIDRLYVSRLQLNTVKTIQNIPVAYSDHSCVKMSCSHLQEKPKSAYWCLNTSYLEDSEYISIIKSFWKNWQDEKQRFDSLLEWWDVGKSKIKFFW